MRITLQHIEEKDFKELDKIPECKFRGRDNLKPSKDVVAHAGNNLVWDFQEGEKCLSWCCNEPPFTDSLDEFIKIIKKDLNLLWEQEDL